MNTWAQCTALQRNRRHQKLRQLIDQGDFFSEENLRELEPLRYQLYIGRYKREGPKYKGGFGGFLQDRLLDNQFQEKLEQALHQDRLGKQEYQGKVDNGLIYQTLEEKNEISEEDMEDNIDEFIQLCHLSFLNGEYPFPENIDDDQSLDDTEQWHRDQEEAYFNKDSPEEEHMEQQGEQGHMGEQREQGHMGEQGEYESGVLDY